MHNHSYGNESNLHVNELSFSNERTGTKTRFEKEAKGDSAMAYSFSIFQDAFDTFLLTLVKVIVMTVGELDYTTMLVNSLEERDPVSHAHLVPYRESSFIFLCLFIFAMPIVLMNLLVSK